MVAYCSPEQAPDEPAYLVLEYEKGDIVAIDGERMTPAQVLRTLNEIAGKHGVGRVDWSIVTSV